MNTKLILAACALCAGSAFAQSHSVTNPANPPGTSAASSAATEATPGQSGHAKKEAKPNGKHRPARKAKAATNSKEHGAEAQMQHAPSEQSTNETEKHAFDKKP
jgi:uncharacterized protein involved in copper resistance